MNSDTAAGVDDPGHRSQQLQTAILRSVSRSFYLSIRALPQQLRGPIALAYLLARTTDTVADTTRIPGTVRMETLKMLSDTIQAKVSREAVINQVASFVPLQENAAERTLLNSLADCLEWLEQIARADRDDIRAVLEKITHGQMLDLHRFDPPPDGFAVTNRTVRIAPRLRPPLPHRAFARESPPRFPVPQRALERVSP